MLKMVYEEGQGERPRMATKLHKQSEAPSLCAIHV